MGLVIIAVSVLVVALGEVQGHGRCRDPVHRGSAWRDGYSTPVNYNDMEQYCGGVAIQYGINGGRCGVCGDDFRDPQPRRNENGGEYGTGTIVKTYQQGQIIYATVELTQSHLGYFEFSLCPLNRGGVETDECFDRNLLKQPNGETKFYIGGSGAQWVTVPLQLPWGLTCEQCSFRWHYRTGNSWGMCDDGTGRLGCGDQEIFRSCSDVKIV